MLVKLTQDTTHRKAGEVVDLDSASAAALIEANRAEKVEDGATGGVERQPRGRGIVTAVQVVDADPYPGDSKSDDSKPSADAQPAEQPAGDAVRAEQVKFLVDTHNRDDLVTLAAHELNKPADQFGDLNKTQIAEQIVDKPQQA